jgi:hypothetical protein
MGRAPAFTAVAVLTLALAIGANTAVFSLVNAVLLRPLPFPDASGLVVVTESLPALGFPILPFGAPDYEDYGRMQRSFEKVALYQNNRYDLSGAGDAERVTAARVSASLFPVLGVAPALGRTFPGRTGAGVVLITACGSAVSRAPTPSGHAAAGRERNDRRASPPAPRAAAHQRRPAELDPPRPHGHATRGRGGYNYTVIDRLLGVTLEAAIASRHHRAHRAGLPGAHAGVLNGAHLALWRCLRGAVGRAGLLTSWRR